MIPEIYAHRGASHDAPENTFAAFNLALESGADGIETDVHLTKDNIPVIIHDTTVNRTTNGKGYVKNFSLSELKELDAGTWFNQKFAQEKIMTLEELLIWINTKPLKLNLELKNNKIVYESLEKMVYDLLNKYSMLEKTIISTFNLKSAQKMASFENLQVAFLLSKRRKMLIKNIKDANINAIHVDYRLLNKQLLEQARQATIDVRVFTVNKALHLRKCYQYACQGIFTDLPKYAVELFNKWTK